MERNGKMLVGQPRNQHKNSLQTKTQSKMLVRQKLRTRTLYEKSQAAKRKKAIATTAFRKEHAIYYLPW